jgi:hypothetical protein
MLKLITSLLITLTVAFICMLNLTLMLTIRLCSINQTYTLTCCRRQQLHPIIHHNCNLNYTPNNNHVRHIQFDPNANVPQTVHRRRLRSQLCLNVQLQLTTRTTMIMIVLVARH